MSKKKRSRQKHEQKIEAGMRAHAAEIIEDTEEFLEWASPRDISEALAETGVSTTNRAAIESILDRALLNMINEKPDTRTVSQRGLYALIDQWKAELALKALPRNFDDLVFLLQMAQHFVLEWAAKHLDVSSDELREIVTRQESQPI